MPDQYYMQLIKSLNDRIAILERQVNILNIVCDRNYKNISDIDKNITAGLDIYE